MWSYPPPNWSCSSACSIRTDRRRLAEIKRRARDGAEFSAGNQPLVDWGETVGGDRQFVAQDVARVLPGEVEVGVVREVDRRGLVRRGGVLDLQLVAVCQGVDDLDRQVAGITLFAVGAGVRQGHLKPRLLDRPPCLPDGLVESPDAAMQVVFPIVDGKRVGRAVEGEPALGDAVAVAADQCPEIRVSRQVVLQPVESQNDVGIAAVAIGAVSETTIPP